MRAEITRGLMHKLKDVPYAINIKPALDELRELERLAEIGGATELAFEFFSMGQPEGDNGEIILYILTVSELLEWAKEIEK